MQFTLDEEAIPFKAAADGRRPRNYSFHGDSTTLSWAALSELSGLRLCLVAVFGRGVIKVILDSRSF